MTGGTYKRKKVRPPQPSREALEAACRTFFERKAAGRAHGALTHAALQHDVHPNTLSDYVSRADTLKDALNRVAARRPVGGQTVLPRELEFAACRAAVDCWAGNQSVSRTHFKHMLYKMAKKHGKKYRARSPPRCTPARAAVPAAARARVNWAPRV